MTTGTLIEALDLPASSRVDQRVPKKLLLENGAPTAADKRHINEGIEELTWLAALKPTTIGVLEYRDDYREYLEIAVLSASLRPASKATRLVELVHRAIPYPVLLLTEQGERGGISGAHKRWSQGVAGKTVLEGDIVAIEWDAEKDRAFWPVFRAALALGKQPHGSLLTVYQGWLDLLIALQAARLTGVFALAESPQRAAARSDALRACALLEAESARLRAAAAKERQVARQVELNLELKRVEAALASAQHKL